MHKYNQPLPTLFRAVPPPPWLGRFFLGSVLFVLLVAACAVNQAEVAPTVTHQVAPAECTIHFGAAVSLTGKTAQEGQWLQDGYRIYANRLNEQGGVRVGDRTCSIAIQFYDDGSDPATSARLVEKLLVEDGVHLLLGPYGTDVVFSASEVAETHQVPMVTAGASGIKIFARGYRYIFGMLPPAPNFLQPVVDLALSEDPEITTVGIFVEDDGYAQEVANGLAAYVQEKGLTVIFRTGYPKDATDLTTIIDEAKQVQPDLIFGAGHLADSILVLETALKRGLTAKLFAFSVGPTSRDFQRALGTDAHYVVGVGPWTEDMRFTGDDLFGTPTVFAQAMRDEYGHEAYASVPYQSAAAAAAIEAYRQAIEAAGTFEDPQAVRNALADLRFDSFYGPVAFSPEGITLKPVNVVQIAPDGELYTVYPHSERTGQFIFPAPSYGP